jgi:hypothetical protein
MILSTATFPCNLNAMAVIDANKLAGNLHSFTTTITHLTQGIHLTSNPIQLHISAQQPSLLTSNKLFKDLPTSPKLPEYIWASTFWSRSTFDSVDWIAAHGQAILKSYAKKTFIVTFVQNLLPMGK